MWPRSAASAHALGASVVCGLWLRGTSSPPRMLQSCVVRAASRRTMVETLCRSAAKGKSAAVHDAAARDGDGEMLGRGAATMQPARRLMRAAVRAPSVHKKYNSRFFIS